MGAKKRIWRATNNGIVNEPHNTRVRAQSRRKKAHRTDEKMARALFPGLTSDFRESITESKSKE